MSRKDVKDSLEKLGFEGIPEEEISRWNRELKIRNSSEDKLFFTGSPDQQLPIEKYRDLLGSKLDPYKKQPVDSPPELSYGFLAEEYGTESSVVANWLESFGGRFEGPDLVNPQGSVVEKKLWEGSLKRHIDKYNAKGLDSLFFRAIDSTSSLAHIKDSLIHAHKSYRKGSVDVARGIFDTYVQEGKVLRSKALERQDWKGSDDVKGLDTRNLAVLVSPLFNTLRMGLTYLCSADADIPEEDVFDNVGLSLESHLEEPTALNYLTLAANNEKSKSYDSSKPFSDSELLDYIRSEEITELAFDIDNFIFTYVNKGGSHSTVYFQNVVYWASGRRLHTQLAQEPEVEYELDPEDPNVTLVAGNSVPELEAIAQAPTPQLRPTPGPLPPKPQEVIELTNRIPPRQKKKKAGRWKLPVFVAGIGALVLGAGIVAYQASQTRHDPNYTKVVAADTGSDIGDVGKDVTVYDADAAKDVGTPDTGVKSKYEPELIRIGTISNKKERQKELQEYLCETGFFPLSAKRDDGINPRAAIKGRLREAYGLEESSSDYRGIEGTLVKDVMTILNIPNIRFRSIYKGKPDGCGGEE